MIRNYRKLFESEFSLDLDDEYYIDEELPDKIEMAGYTWSKIGEIDGNYLYLCDDIVRKMAFSETGSDNWQESDVRRWLNKEFYKKIPSEYKYRIVIYNGDDVFLLSIDEFEKFKTNINDIHKRWWLRSPGIDTKRFTDVGYGGTKHVADVGYDGCGIIYGSNVFYKLNGVRPALLLR